MARRGLFWQLFPANALIAVGALLAVALYARHTVREFYHDQMRGVLEARARLVGERIEQMLPPADPAALDGLVKKLGKLTETRITVILPSGKVVADSEEDVTRMDNHHGRPEIALALQTGQPHDSMRQSDTLRENLMYVAVPLVRDGRIPAVVRTALPTAELDASRQAIERSIWAAAALAAVLMILASWWIVGRISQPLRAMTTGAAAYARGDLDQRLPVGGPREVAVLADAMEQMAGQLHERFETITRQRNQQEAMVSSMVEGVLALDGEGRVLSLNLSGARMLDLDPAAARGRLLHEVLRKPDLLELVDRLAGRHDEVAEEIVLHGARDRHLSVHGMPLRDAQRRTIGTLVVLHDVTRLRQLETVRRDFVANASHELRTPITSIKGYAETLLDGALENPDDARRFVQTILNQANRLIAILADIFALARIEKDAEAGGIVLEPGPIGPVIEASVRACRSLAEAKRIAIELESEDGLRARINPRLLEQAVVNLLDNAVKFSPDGSTVRVTGRREGEWVIVRVVDEGCGIEPRHLPRLFERFYQVDKSHSRALGGTGLGLSIVRHIVLAHDGSATAESKVGVGSTFTIRLPAL